MKRRTFVKLAGAGTAAALRGGALAQGPPRRGGPPRVLVLEGVRPLAFRVGKQCTFIGALEAVLRYHREAWDYVDLMGLSGAAFRVRVAYPSSDHIMGGRIHPGISVDATFGPHIDWLSEATGYTFDVDAPLFHEEKGWETVAMRVQLELEERRPVIALNLQGASRWGVLAGYHAGFPLLDAQGEPQGKRFLCRTYYDDLDADYTQAPGAPWDCYFVQKIGQPLLEEEAMWSAVRHATELLQTSMAEVTRPSAWMWFFEQEYGNGIAAYDAWVRDLEDEEAIAALPPEQFLMYWQGHAWMYDALHDARRAAMLYLERIAPKFAPREQGLLQEARESYEELLQVMHAGWRHFPSRDTGYIEPKTGWWLRVEQEEFMGTVVPAYSDEWTPRGREQAVSTLRTIKVMDEEALEALEQLG